MGSFLKNDFEINRVKDMCTRNKIVIYHVPQAYFDTFFFTSVCSDVDLRCTRKRKPDFVYGVRCFTF